MILLNNPHNQRIYRYLGHGNYKYVESPLVNWPISARNVHQVMALDLLFDKDINMISLTGPAGTGKTFLAVLAGLHQVFELDIPQFVPGTNNTVPAPEFGPHSTAISPDGARGATGGRR